MKVQLLDVPRGSFVALVGEGSRPPDDNASIPNNIVKFHKLDGMYSYCTTKSGDVVHLSAWTEVMIVDQPTDWND